MEKYEMWMTKLFFTKISEMMNDGILGCIFALFFLLFLPVTLVKDAIFFVIWVFGVLGESFQSSDK